MVCKGYVGLACVNGMCPIALANDYPEMGMDVISSCEECSYYNGCLDCAFFNTAYCLRQENSEV